MKTYTDVASREFDAAFIAGFGKQLATAGAGAWRDDGTAFGDSEIAIVAGTLPSSPAAAIGLTSYGVSDDPLNSDTVQALQVMSRADGSDDRATARVAGSVYDALHGLTGVVLPGGVYVVQCLRQSWTWTGQDTNNRWRLSQNFYVTVHRPSQHRI